MGRLREKGTKMTLLEFIKEIPLATMILVGIGIFEFVQLLLGKRKAKKFNIICYGCVIGYTILFELTNLIAHLAANEPLTPINIAVSIITFIFFSVFLVYECIFYK